MSELIEYGECPVKLDYSSSKTLVSQEDLTKSIISNCYDKIVRTAVTGFFPSKKSFDNIFNREWHKLKAIYRSETSTDYLLSIRNRCNKVYDFFSSLKSLEVIALDQLFEYSTEVGAIRFDVNVIRSSNNIYFLFQDKLLSSTKIPKMYQVVYSILQSCSKDFLSGFAYSCKPLIVRMQDFSFHSLLPLKDLSNVVSNIIVGMNHSRYPVVGLHCKTCDKKINCSWSNE